MAEDQTRLAALQFLKAAKDKTRPGCYFQVGDLVVFDRLPAGKPAHGRVGVITNLSLTRFEGSASVGWINDRGKVQHHMYRLTCFSKLTPDLWKQYRLRNLHVIHKFE